jgi:long-chain acyl-CoA synthetase
MTPISALYGRARKQPDSLAFVAGDDVWSYRRLATEADRLACALLARGVGAGDRVVLHMANLPEVAVAYYACFRIGAIACPLSITFKTAELQQLLYRLRPALYLGQAQAYAQIAPVGPVVLASDARFVVGDAGETSGARAWDELFVGIADRSLPPCPDVGLPAALLTTSGTTGHPKFVAHTPATLSAIAESFLHLGLDKEQVAINAVPMMHVGGLATFLGCVHFGRPMVLFDRFDADTVLDAMGPHRCSWLIGVPRMYAALVERQRMRPRRVDSLRFCLVAGDVCPVPLQQDFATLFGVPLRSFWGSTETFGTFAYGLRPGPVTRPAPGTGFRLVDDKGEPAPRGEVGELVVRGPSVTVGYWSGPGRIDAPPDGWFSTGDLMREGEKHEFWFVSRKKDLIIRGGSNISPIEVEQVLMAHPAVRDAAVIGIPDAILGQRVVGLVTLANGAGPSALDDILTDAKTRLADYKVPERLEVVDEIPKNALGKIDRTSMLKQTQVMPDRALSDPQPRGGRCRGLSFCATWSAETLRLKYCVTIS